MDALLLVIVTFVGYLIAYHTYGRFLAKRIFKLDDSRPVPSREMEDGLDYVPTRKGIIFGHHYTSIAGTGPIVGPAIGIIWGWVPAIIWVFVGSIVMGAVHDFGALVLSLRNQGKSISEVASRYVNRRVRTALFLVFFFLLWIVIAIFGVVIALTFRTFPKAIFPIWMQIPIAMGLGYMIYKRRANVVLCTVIAVVMMYLSIVDGNLLPIRMPDILAHRGGEVVFYLPATGIWVVILLIYAYFASSLPVTMLLQPRDYINAWQLFIAMTLLILGVAASAFGRGLPIVAPAFNLSPVGAPPIWPFLFVTIACGAVSGFHALVASGTTPKQISRESDAQFVGYGSMLLEAALATLVIVAVAAGIGIAYQTQRGVLTGTAAWSQHYATWGAAQGLTDKIEAVVVGSANMLAGFGLPHCLGVIIMGVFIASFAGTTLDTATRIQRYVLTEIATDLKIPLLSNRWVATAVAVVTAGILAFATGADGKGALLLWPMFGACNQILAGLALMLITLYLKKRGGRAYLLSGIPCLFMLALTLVAVIYNEVYFFYTHKPLLLCANGAMCLLALWIIVESAIAFFRPRPAAQQS